MSLNVWTKPSGYSLGTFEGADSLEIQLPVDLSVTDVNFNLISGKLPKGLFLAGSRIIGSAFTTDAVLDFNFCIRASKNSSFADRTFNLKIASTKAPTFVTNAGSLDIGIHKQFYVLDGSYVDYQLEAFDLDTATENLKFFIGSGDGQLPPGLTMDETGRISGYIIPVLTLTPDIGNGFYDGSIYDAIAFDFGQISSDGYDNYSYDDVFFDFNVPTKQVISLNANYQFRVTLTDGINSVQRVFRIFVVGNDQFRADSTSQLGLADTFTADATYIRQPVWINQSNLGLFRANNYLTIPLALYDEKVVSFRVEVTNQEVYSNSFKLLGTDNIAGGNSITITNVRGTPTIGQYFSLLNYVTNATDNIYQISNVVDLGNGNYRLTSFTPLTSSIPNGTVIYLGTLSTLPLGTSFDPQTGDIYGVVPYQPAITKRYTFTLTATRYGVKTESVSASKTFYIDIIGDITSQINWNTPPNLGSIPADYICTLSVSASSSIPNATVIYEVTSGSLPPGLELSPDGEIIGKVNQFYRPATEQAGLITFDEKGDRSTIDGGNAFTTGDFYVDGGDAIPSFSYGPNSVNPDGGNATSTYETSGPTTFDNRTTTFDRAYRFTIKASDQYGYSASTRTFVLNITTPNTVTYSNIIAKPFLTQTQRSYWQDFINNTNVFTPTSVYRTNDPNFGVQSSLSMIVYAGIETKEAAAYIGAMGLGHKRKRFQFGGVKKAVAVDPVTGESVYEVVYVQMLDPMEPNGKHLPRSITTSLQPNELTVDLSNSIWSRNLADLIADAPEAKRPEPILTVDSTGYEVSNPKVDTYFPNSISNWRSRIKEVGLNERNYLPLWMRSIPLGSKKQLGYTLAVPLCFCKVGTADTILLNIKFSGFDFKNIDYTIDRFIIDSVEGYYQDKYLVFRNDKITV